MNLAKGLSILFYFFKELALSFIDLSYFLFSLYFIYTLSDLYYFLLLSLSFIHFSFSGSLRYKVGLFEIFLPSCCKHLFAMIFLLRTVFVACHKFWYVLFPFSFVLRYFFISLFTSLLTHWWFSTVLFNLHICVNFLVFL